jgi:hypothetical protein
MHYGLVLARREDDCPTPVDRIQAAHLDLQQTKGFGNDINLSFLRTTQEVLSIRREASLDL